MKYKALKTSNCVSCFKQLKNPKQVLGGHVRLETLGAAKDSGRFVIGIMASFCVPCVTNGAMEKDDDNGCFGDWNEKMGIEPLEW